MQCTAFIMQCLASIGGEGVLSELWFKGTILQKYVKFHGKKKSIKHIMSMKHQFKISLLLLALNKYLFISKC